MAASVVALGVLAAGQGFVSPSLSTLLSRSAPVGHQGALLGVGQGMAALARAVGPIAAGALFDVRVDLPFWGAAVGIAFAAWLLLRLGPFVSSSAPFETGDET
jgi:DHA1 family tetracycline resistance protein-like MFS transporter